MAKSNEQGPRGLAPIVGPEQRRAVIRVNEGMTLGNRVRSAGETFRADEVDALLFEDISNGFVPGVEIAEDRVNPYTEAQTVPDIVVGFDASGAPIYLPGDRRGNASVILSSQSHNRVTRMLRAEDGPQEVEGVDLENAPSVADEAAANIAAGAEGDAVSEPNTDANPGDAEVNAMRVALEGATGAEAALVDEAVFAERDGKTPEEIEAEGQTEEGGQPLSADAMAEGEGDAGTPGPRRLGRGSKQAK